MSFVSCAHLDPICFQAFIDQGAATVSATLNLLRLARGTFHRAKALEIPQQLSCICQPAANPALTPRERVWPYLHERLAGKTFAALDDLCNAVSRLLTGITPERRQSLPGCDYFTTAVTGVFI
jgi:hypothetical protein